MINGILPNGNHHLGHGNNQRPGLRLHLLPGKNGAQTKRVSVLIGNHSDQTRERSGLKIVGFMAVTILMVVSE